MRLFCFPYAGAGPFIFRSWPSGLPHDVEVCPIELPGRARRIKEPPYTRLEPLVAGVARLISPVLDQPFAFFGHSMGALISFELARHLRREGGPQPVHLFVSGRRAPQLPDSDPKLYDLPEPEFLDELRRLNGTAREFFEHPEVMQIITPVLRADFSVCQTYVYTAEPPLDYPITVYGGVLDPESSDGRLQAWHEQTTSSFTVRTFPGDHFFLNTAQTELLQALFDELATAGT
jgi:medium-chain acyl-[acyl-carrier-protein] hydrolase